MHTLQRKILAILNQSSGKRFSELKSDFKSNEKFEYHLKELVHKKYIRKEKSLYKLTTLGGFQLKNFDLESLADVDSKLPILILILKYKDKFLLRKKRDHFGTWPIRLHVGRSVIETIESKLQKYKIEGEYRFVKVLSMRGLDRKQEFAYDNVFLIFEVNVVHFDKNNETLKMVDKTFFTKQDVLFKEYLDRDTFFSEREQYLE